MSILSGLKKAERSAVSQRRRDIANRRYQENWDRRIIAACKKMIREEIKPLDGRKVNGQTITVKPMEGGYRLTTTGFGYDLERTLEFTTDIFTGSFRPADDCPEQDYRSVGIRIKWWRRGERCGSDEMSDSVTLNSGALNWDKEVKEKRKEFTKTVLEHIKRMVFPDE